MTTKVILCGSDGLITMFCLCVYWTWCCYIQSLSLAAVAMQKLSKSDYLQLLMWN